MILSQTKKNAVSGMCGAFYGFAALYLYQRSHVSIVLLAFGWLIQAVSVALALGWAVANVQDNIARRKTWWQQRQWMWRK